MEIFIDNMCECTKLLQVKQLMPGKTQHEFLYIYKWRIYKLFKLLNLLKTDLLTHRHDILAWFIEFHFLSLSLHPVFETIVNDNKAICPTRKHAIQPQNQIHCSLHPLNPIQPQHQKHCQQSTCWISCRKCGCQV